MQYVHNWKCKVKLTIKINARLLFVDGHDTIGLSNDDFYVCDKGLV